ncbi:MAG: phosphatase PAP2 family protein [Clostridium sp.]|uniref:phosphatase PAP2 family protein n=1 Tax=Clostridium sp. TaxID=1506 RepID=UPI0025BF6E6B|nr:phosphatase PAP2 family protein [Clostridium sp.]MCH3964900.1 phosphatase PAP2 family protein [Clostridium sp.]MCI1716606.1 phosphatase PAP2 family protein [Clostridium sp.]MCI1800912.1 phosphatase PAP2 family protein [Clostridium sp.]MCI1814783.1 phosphatase PAP2 family protein [Clostridium sp.]MCI1871659.1 phosphatase PAP2 family protein [Clostridium sp.]
MYYSIKRRNFTYNIQYILSRFLNLLYKYYFIVIGAFFVGSGIYLCFYPSISETSKIYMFVLAFISFSVYKDMRNDVKLLPFLLMSIPFLLLVLYLNRNGYAMWGKMLHWQISRSIIINLNPLFSIIPFNDGSFARIYTSKTLTSYFRIVYNNGFVLPVLLAIYRSAISLDFKKMLRYALSAHIVQVFLITPFYLVFHLQEVWYVLGQPDGLARNLSKNAAAGVTLNCFPSMHTSIAFAMFLLALREKDKLFKIFMSFFCMSIIFSTLYLRIHWVLDIAGGILLAYVTVKLVDFTFAKLQPILQKLLDKFYYKNCKVSYIYNYYLDTMN